MRYLILGDTNSSLAAIAAKRRHIPIFHMEAGNRCFDQRVPEESEQEDRRSHCRHQSSLQRSRPGKPDAEGLPTDRVIRRAARCTR